MDDKIALPRRVCLQDYGGDYHRYIDAIYEIFENDFIRKKTCLGSHELRLKFHPIFQERAYTFYHMTHKGEKEDERIPDLQRCECMPWAKPTIEHVTHWKLKFWRQNRRRSKDRMCICFENPDDDIAGYFVIVEVRADYVLLWTAFVSEYNHEMRKKLQEYAQWKKNMSVNDMTPDRLIAEIQQEIKARSDYDQ